MTKIPDGSKESQDLKDHKIGDSGGFIPRNDPIYNRTTVAVLMSSDTTSMNNYDQGDNPSQSNYPKAVSIKKKREYKKPFVNVPISQNYGVSELVAKSKLTRPSSRAGKTGGAATTRDGFDFTGSRGKNNQNQETNTIYYSKFTDGNNIANDYVQAADHAAVIKNLNRSLSHDSNKSMDEVLKKKKKKTRRWIFRRKKKCQSPVLKSYHQQKQAANEERLENEDICNVTEQAGGVDRDQNRTGRESSVDLTSFQCAPLNTIGCSEPNFYQCKTIQKTSESQNADAS